MVYNFNAAAAVLRLRAASSPRIVFELNPMATIAPILNERLNSVCEMCRQHHVACLELFGSAATGRFDALHSDLDFLVEFGPLPPADRADAYFGLLAGLQDLFQRDVDLVEAGAVDNPYFRRTIEDTRTVLYAA
jgi:predicted nucleotidyltransferase